VCAKGTMSKKKGPPGYPGDEVINQEFGKTIQQLRLERGLSEEEAQALLDESTRNEPHPLLPRAIALVIRQSREGKKMSRIQLSEASGVPLKRINRLERGKTADLTLTEIVRIAMALEHPVTELVEAIEEREKKLRKDQKI